MENCFFFGCNRGVFICCEVAISAVVCLVAFAVDNDAWCVVGVCRCFPGM